MTRRTPPDLRVLHAVRITGHAPALRIADLVDLPGPEVEEHLEDARARGWVTEVAFAGDRTWTLTDAGRAHGETLLAAELDDAAARPAVEQVYREFRPVGDAVAAACSSWQLTDLGVADPPARLADVLAVLRESACALDVLEQRLTAHLVRFGGYHRRCAAALAAAATNADWIAGPDRDSVDRIWLELHEDLLATLGRSRY